MAFAKEMTIATGHTVRVNGDEHEIKVSLTYELERDDHDMLLLAAVKAGEVQNAHKAACQQMHSLWTHESATGQASFTDEDVPPHDETDEDEAFGQEDEPPASAVAVTFQSPPPPPTANGRTHGRPNGYGFGKPNAPAPQNGGQRADEKAEERAEERPLSPGEEPATTPQKIAIRSLVKQAGLDDTRLRDLLWDNFETVRLEKLTKYQAARLMLALKDGSWQNGIPNATIHATTKATIH